MKIELKKIQIREVSNGYINDNIEQYMAENQHKPNASELWLYFTSLMTWIKVVFPKYRKEMSTTTKSYPDGFPIQDELHEAATTTNLIIITIPFSDSTIKYGTNSSHLSIDNDGHIEVVMDFSGLDYVSHKHTITPEQVSMIRKWIKTLIYK